MSRDHVLDFRVIGHGAADRERGLALDPSQRQIDRASRDAVIDVGEPHQRPGEDAEHEGVGRARRQDAGDVAIRHEGAVQHHVVAAGRAHAHRVPGLDDLIAGRLAGHEDVDDFRAALGVRPRRVQAVARQHRRQAAEHLVPGDAEAALHALGLAGGQQHRQVVAALGVAGVEHFAGHGFPQHPFQRFVALAPEIGG